MYVKLKRQTVASEVIYIAMGIDEDGHREILSFSIGGKESAYGWREALQDLHCRGVHEVLLGVFDGLAGLEVAFKETYPKAVQNDVQAFRPMKPAPKHMGETKNILMLFRF